MGQPTTFVRQLRSRLLRREAAGAADAALLGAYLDRRDEAAFEALVRRHGPMVLGVCRRILGNPADADDAFQATFLVLVRKAAAVRPRSLVGNWLYGVACRTARDARRAAARRRAKEAAVVPRPQPPEDDRSDLWAVLDGELQRLPARSRAVLLLSDLEGKTRAEVARQLGWPEGTVASRLARARAKLARRLARHGLAVTAASLGALLPDGAALAVPGPLVASTVQAAGLLAAGPAAAALIPAQVTALTEGALNAMLLKKVLYAAALVVVVGALGTGTGLVGSRAGGSDKPDPAKGPTDRPDVVAAGAPAVIARGRGGAPEVDLAKELDRLKGVWVCVGYERDGEEHTDPQAREAMWNETLWFHGTTPGDDWLNLSWERTGRQTSALALFRLRPTTPRGIDLTWKAIPAHEFMPNGIDPAWEDATKDERKLDRAQPGVYSFDGGRLRLCWGELGGDRPPDTKTKRGDPRTVHLYEKRKE